MSFGLYLHVVQGEMSLNYITLQPRRLVTLHNNNYEPHDNCGGDGGGGNNTVDVNCHSNIFSSTLLAVCSNKIAKH
jgi:hypothetical protein